MANDSFADLWNSSAPTKPTPIPQTLGSTNSSSQLNIGPKRPQQDVFSLLSSAGSSVPSSRPITPSSFPKPKPKPAPSKPLATSGPAGGDAFSGLLSGSIATSNTTSMTIAEKAALAEKQKMEQYLKQQDQARTQASAWDGLDSLAASGMDSTPGMASQAIDSQGDGWDLGMTASSSSTSAKQTSHVVEDDDWGLSDFASAPSTTDLSPPAAPTQSIWDFDVITSPAATVASTTTTSYPSHPIIRESVSRSNSPGDFDFGDREDTQPDDDSHDEDDILGALSKPVHTIPKRTSPGISSLNATPSPELRPTSAASTTRTVSPPPHIIGQIVEMGFSLQQARVALAATDTGLDVQAALETLLANGVGSDNWQKERSQEEREDIPRSRLSNDEPPRRRQRPLHTRNILNRDTPSPSGSQQDKNVQLQEHADKLLAQASEIGLNVFNRANAIWNQGKEKAQKLYEERAAAMAAKGAVRSGGRPRWMQDRNIEMKEEELDWGLNGKGKAEFPDDNGDVLPPKPSSKPGPSHQKPVESQPVVPAATGGLFSDTPSTYVSPFRHGRPKSPSSLTPSPQAPSPVQLVQRQAVSASPTAIATSAKHKAFGTEKYKLGQFGEAETAYSNAIAALPNSHLLLVPLYNNRALTRIKIGNPSGAVDDCTAVIELIGVSYNPGQETKVTKEECGAGVDLSDGLVKALKRRAEAREGREKWDEARKDWEVLAGIGWAPGPTRSEAVRGAGRCKKMAIPVLDTPAASNPRPKLGPPKKPSPQPAPTPSSQALNKLRKATNAQEAEDQARHELKDLVDARLIAWKCGKETNIRALLASLDTVLWPELGWQKVGMAEVVTSSQVKIRYTKAIAKLHPDKLNANNTTLEQRMIANGIFGALNEAWNAFKQ